MIKKARTPKRSSRVVTMTFEPGNHIEIAGVKPASPPGGENRVHEKPRKNSNGKTPTVSAQDRHRLKDIEIFLNNCLNLANSIDDERAGKIAQLLRDARSQAIHLRG